MIQRALTADVARSVARASILRVGTHHCSYPADAARPRTVELIRIRLRELRGLLETMIAPDTFDSRVSRLLDRVADLEERLAPDDDAERWARSLRDDAERRLENCERYGSIWEIR